MNGPSGRPTVAITLGAGTLHAGAANQDRQLLALPDSYQCCDDDNNMGGALAAVVNDRGSSNDGFSRTDDEEMPQRALVNVDDEAGSSSANGELPWADNDIEDATLRDALAIYQTMPSNGDIADFENMFNNRIRERIVTDSHNIVAMQNINSILRTRNAKLTAEIDQNKKNRFMVFYKRYKMFLEFNKLLEQHSYLLTEEDLRI